MKKLLLFPVLMLLCIVQVFPQATFNTGAIRLDVNQYGRIRIFTPDDVRHLQRASILVGTAQNAVFDYTNDAEQLEPTVLVSNPAMSNYEIYGAYDNSYSNLPPNVIEKLNAYGWTNAPYIIHKFNIKNNETEAINAFIGLDMIPELNEEYGYDTVSYNNAEGVIWFHRGNQEHLGVKLLNASLSSLYSFEWFEDYSTDPNYWNYMHYGSLQPQYISTTADGPVTVTSQNAVTLAPQEAVDVFYAMAIGATEQAMLTNMAAAVAKYQSLFTGIDDQMVSSNELVLGQNRPNPVTQSARITYWLPESGLVTLKVFNAVGKEVATLVNSKQTKGSYTVTMDASGLPGGIYFYRLMFNDQVQSRRMMVVR